MTRAFFLRFILVVNLPTKLLIFSPSGFVVVKPSPQLDHLILSGFFAYFSSQKNHLKAAVCAVSPTHISFDLCVCIFSELCSCV